MVVDLLFLLCRRSRHGYREIRGLPLTLSGAAVGMHIGTILVDKLVIQSLAALGTNRIIELIGTIRTESIVRADTIDRHHLLNKERLHELALAVETDKVSGMVELTHRLDTILPLDKGPTFRTLHGCHCFEALIAIQDIFSHSKRHILETFLTILANQTLRMEKLRTYGRHRFANIHQTVGTKTRHNKSTSKKE